MPDRSTYRVPQQDLRFVLHEWLGVAQALPQLDLPACPDRPAIDALIAELARFAENTLAPLNPIGDEQGCHWKDGEVATPAGFREAYEVYRQRGWVGLGADPAHGGRGLPTVLTSLVTEIVGTANHSWLMYHSISRGGYACIHANGTPDQHARYLPRLASGEWMSSMCITERQAGTDVGLIKTRAVAQGDGHYRLSGLKWMATVAEHDLATNILHLVLARIEGAPSGSSGLSLFVVPKRLADGQRNAVRCEALDEKLGIRGTPTCRMRFDGAWGELLGQPGKGLAAMFVMMNIARLGTGMQGMNQAEGAYQMALRHAQQRLQGRAQRGGAPAGPQPLTVHADVRRMLLTQKAWTQGARALAYWLAWQVDCGQAHPDPQQRQQADAMVALLTPVFKAFATDNGYTCATLAQQVMGGWGYLGASGVHQFLRDVRVGQIYEGANGIQGQDLLGRKVLADGGARLALFRAHIDSAAATLGQHPALCNWAQDLIRLNLRVSEISAGLARRAMRGEPDLVGACGTGYLRVLGLLTLAWIWLERAALAQRHIDQGVTDPFYADQRVTARFYFAHLLPEVEHHLAVLTVDSEAVLAETLDF